MRIKWENPKISYINNFLINKFENILSIKSILHNNLVQNNSSTENNIYLSNVFFNF